MVALINTYLNLVKACLALEVRSIADWPKILALEAFVFLTHINFLDLVVFWSFAIL